MDKNKPIGCKHVSELQQQLEEAKKEVERLEGEMEEEKYCDGCIYIVLMEHVGIRERAYIARIKDLENKTNGEK